MKEITVSGRKILFVPAPEGWKPIVIDTINAPSIVCIERLEGKEDRLAWLKIAVGNWQLVGLASELTEEQAAGLVEKVLAENEMGGFDPCYREYRNDRYANTSAIDSFRSLLTSLQLEGEQIVLVQNEK